jgi:5-methyltetrahydrofolate--homocysteine methyltransferase
LLVSTSKQMPLIVNELQRRGLQFPVLIGGAAINRRFGRRILLTEDGKPYKPGVFYCKDAFEGLATMDALMDGERRAELLERIQREAELETGRKGKVKTSTPAGSRSAVPPALRIPRPNLWGARTVREMPLEMVFQYLYKNELFRLSWGAKNAHGQEWEKLQAEFEARLARMQREALAKGWLCNRRRSMATGPPRRKATNCWSMKRLVWRAVSPGDLALQLPTPAGWRTLPAWPITSRRLNRVSWTWSLCRW